MRNKVGKLAVNFADAGSAIKPVLKRIGELRDQVYDYQGTELHDRIYEIYDTFGRILEDIFVPSYDLLIKGFESLDDKDLELLAMYIEQVDPDFFYYERLNPDDVVSLCIKGLKYMMNQDVDMYQHHLELIKQYKINFVWNTMLTENIGDIYFLLTGNGTKDSLYELKRIMGIGRW